MATEAAAAEKPEKVQKPEETFEAGNIVLGKIRGHPHWPAQVVDGDSVPRVVQKDKPKGKGPWYCVRFFPAGDHSWLVPKDISILTKQAIEDYIAKPTSKRADLLNGYKVAQDPTEWNKEYEQRAAELIQQAEDAEVDELDDDGDGKKKGGKKRKRESEGAAKAARKRKSKNDQDSDDDDDAPKKKRKGAAAKKGGKRAKDGSDDDKPSKSKRGKKDKEEDEDESPLANDPEAVKIKDWRHHLQRGFLRDNNPPDAESLQGFDETFKTIESYDGLTIEYLSYSKIGKVMKKISQLGDEVIPNGDQYNFRTRASALVTKWQGILNKKPEGEGDAAPATNGDAPKENGAAAAIDPEMSMMTDA